MCTTVLPEAEEDRSMKIVDTTLHLSVGMTNHLDFEERYISSPPKSICSSEECSVAESSDSTLNHLPQVETDPHREATSTSPPPEYVPPSEESVATEQSRFKLIQLPPGETHSDSAGLSVSPPSESTMDQPLEIDNQPECQENFVSIPPEAASSVCSASTSSGQHCECF